MRRFQTKWWIVGFAGLHFIIERALFLISFSAGMNQIDRGDSLTMSNKVVELAAKILEFPLITLSVAWLPQGTMPGLYGYLLFIVNSFIWGSTIWLMLQRRTLNS